MMGRMQKTLAEVKGCPQKDRTESEGYVEVQTVMWICEDNIVEVPFDKEHLLERILSPENLLNAYKAVSVIRAVAVSTKCHVSKCFHGSWLIRML